MSQSQNLSNDKGLLSGVRQFSKKIKKIFGVLSGGIFSPIGKGEPVDEREKVKKTAMSTSKKVKIMHKLIHVHCTYCKHFQWG